MNHYPAAKVAVTLGIGDALGGPEPQVGKMPCIILEVDRSIGPVRGLMESV